MIFSNAGKILLDIDQVLSGDEFSLMSEAA
jgi:hypothetical protein